jgi:hypothetical protein
MMSTMRRRSAPHKNDEMSLSKPTPNCLNEQDNG